MEVKESLKAEILVERIWKILVMEKNDGMLNYCAGFHVVWLCLYIFMDENKIQVMVTARKIKWLFYYSLTKRCN